MELFLNCILFTSEFDAIRKLLASLAAVSMVTAISVARAKVS